MRLKLVLKIVEGTVLPCNYMYELSSCLYKVLNEGNPVFTAWLHDKGYCKEKKAFKLFTFSNFYFPCFRIEGDRIFVLADTAQLIVSFYPIEAIDAFVMGLFKNRQLEVGDRKSRVRFEVFNLERQAEPEFTSGCFLKLYRLCLLKSNYRKPESDTSFTGESEVCRIVAFESAG